MRLIELTLLASKRLWQWRYGSGHTFQEKENMLMYFKKCLNICKCINCVKVCQRIRVNTVLVHRLLYRMCTCGKIACSWASGHKFCIQENLWSAFLFRKMYLYILIRLSSLPPLQWVCQRKVGNSNTQGFLFQGQHGWYY